MKVRGVVETELREGDGRAREEEEGRLLAFVIVTNHLGNAETDRELVLSMTLSTLLRPGAFVQTRLSPFLPQG